MKLRAKDILKKGAKLKAKKLDKKQRKKLNEILRKLEIEYSIPRSFTWEELHTPMTI